MITKKTRGRSRDGKIIYHPKSPCQYNPQLLLGISYGDTNKHLITIDTSNYRGKKVRPNGLSPRTPG